NQAILDAFNTGTVLFSFVGHGNPEVWTHESVLNVPSSINAMTNFDRLAYVTTATCDFSEYDDFNTFSGGELFLMSPAGGAIGLLGTSREVTSGESLVQYFYQTLFHQDIDKGTSTVGQAMLVGKLDGSGNYPYFYLLGDPAQRLLLPKLYVTFDSLNGSPLSSTSTPLAALSQVRIAGSIRDGSSNLTVDQTFNGTVTVTLYDSPTMVEAASFFPTDTIRDTYSIEGPILFRGTATVTNGDFTITFIVPRDVKLDSGAAKLSGYAYSGSDGRTALGDNKGIQLTGSDSTLAVIDTAGPALQVWLGSRSFKSGDDVSMHSTAIVDVADLHGLNTSTASIGHSFIAWVDNAVDSAIDLASTYVSKENDFTKGTSIHAIELPAGHHTLHVRAFNTYDNPTFASVDFVAKQGAPYQLYDVIAVPDPIIDHTTFSLVQPGSAGSLVNVTLSLYRTNGGFVRALTASSRESAIDIPWDGRDATGTAVADGVYVFIVNVQNVDDGTSSIATGKCVVTR
ncbi:MAG: C25 family cysteine peptidase, partial [Candidatus Kapaibacterium sp.]